MPVFIPQRLLQYGAGVEENVMPFSGLGRVGYVPRGGRAVAARRRANYSRKPQARRNVYTARLLKPRQGAFHTRPAPSIGFQRLPHMRHTARPAPRHVPRPAPAPRPAPQIIYKTDPNIAKQMAEMKAQMAANAKARAASDAAALETARKREAADAEAKGKILGMKKSTALLAAGAAGVAVFMMKD